MTQFRVPQKWNLRLWVSRFYLEDDPISGLLRK